MPAVNRGGGDGIGVGGKMAVGSQKRNQHTATGERLSEKLAALCMVWCWKVESIARNGFRRWLKSEDGKSKKISMCLQGSSWKTF